MSKPSVTKAEKPSKKAKKLEGTEEGKVRKTKAPHNSEEKTSKKASKSNGAKEEATSARSVKSVLNLEEKSFPRGGASVLTPIERKQIQIQADKDALFEESGKKRALPADISDEEGDGDASEVKAVKTRKKRKTKASGKGAAEEVAEKVERIQSLSFKTLVPGSLVLGQVVQITSKDIAIALPNRLTGYVPLTSVSSQLTKRVEKLLEEAEDDGEESEDFDDVELKQLFQIGQYLRVSVTSNEEMQGGRQNRHLELSLDPRLTNAGITKDDLVVHSTVQASIASVEDGGLVMDLGIDGVSAHGFVSANELGADVKLSDMQEGAVLLCIVTGQSSNGKVIKLSANPAKIGDMKKGHYLTNAPTINTFLPGTAATVLISEATRSGIRGSIMGMLDVTADLVHAGGAQGKQDLEKRYKAGSKIQARVLFSVPKDNARKVGVSTVDHLLSLSTNSLANKQGASPVEQLPLSSIVESAKVTKVKARSGIYLDVGIPRVQAFAHISKLSDKKVDDVFEDQGAYKLDSVHKARITGYNPLDGLFEASLQESVLSQPFLRLEDVKPGEIVEGTIESMPVKGNGVSGLLINLAEGVRGFIRRIHMSDVELKHPERKFREGQKVRARVLTVDSEKRAIFLTMKRSLIGSEAAPWTSYDAINIGDQSPGTVHKLTPKGAWIHFYGEVRAFLPVGHMFEVFIKDPTEHFRVGQVLNVHAISIDAPGKRMLVSCKNLSVSIRETEEKLGKIEPCQIVSGTIIEIGKELVTLELEGGVHAYLPSSHLTDKSEKKNAAALQKLRADQSIEVVVLQKMLRSRTVRVSNKPSLMKAARKGKLLSSLDQVKQGKQVDGFITNVNATGIFVEFAGHLSALIPQSGMPDDMRLKQVQNYGVTVGQSITATVWNIYPEDGRFTLTLREGVTEAPEKEEKKAPMGKRAAPGSLAAPELVNAVDDKLKSITDLEVGSKTLVRVEAIKTHQLNVKIADNLQGRVHISEVFKDFESIKDPKKPLDSIKHNSTIPIAVLGVHNAKTYKFLPFTARSATHPVYECSHKQADRDEIENLILAKLKVGEERVAFLHSYSGRDVHVDLSPEVHGIIDVADLGSIDSNYEEVFPVGCALRAKVSKIDLDKNRVYLVPVGAKDTSEREIEVGGIYVGRVTKATPEGVDVELAKGVWGRVSLLELDDDFEKAQPQGYSKRAAIKVKVLGRDEEKGHLILSARTSLTSSDAAADVKDARITEAEDLSVGQVLRGFVHNVSTKGAIVRIGSNILAHAPVHEMADEYVKDVKTLFKQHQLVTGKIVKVDAEDGHHKISLRQSVIKDPNWKPAIEFSSIEVGDIVDAEVAKVVEYGVFISVKNSKNVRGLCHVKELANMRVENPADLYSEGDKVKAKVIKLDREKRQINFSLKAIHFQDVDEDGAGEGAQESEDDDEEMGGVDLTNVQDMHEDEEKVNESEDVEMEDAEEEKSSSKRKSGVGLKVNGFDWNGIADAGDANGEVSEAEEQQPKKKKRKGEIQVDKTGDLDKLGPQSVSDFERLLLGQPNSSALWIQYMAFQLGLSEVDKAREVAERALKTIHMREEDEKMNIWVALLNLENTYGTEETLDGVFERASQYTDKKEINSRLASIFIDSGKHKEAEALFEKMRKVREISSDSNYWLNYATFLMSSANRPDEARGLLQRATQALPSHEHAHVISRFGALEFASPNGDIERGRTIFEGLVDAYKSSWDLWDQYLAQELSSKGDVEKARGLFERMAKMKMKPKRAKYLFKRWLNWERELAVKGEGSDKQVARVRFLAEEYVETHGMKAGVAEEIVEDDKKMEATSSGAKKGKGKKKA